MATTLRLKRFSNAAILKRIDTGLLMQFLTPFRDFLVGQRDMEWSDDPGEFDHAALAKILMSPSMDTPDELLDALYFVDGLADGDSYDRILEEAQDAGINLGAEDPTPEDLTLRVWLTDRTSISPPTPHASRLRPI